MCPITVTAAIIIHHDCVLLARRKSGQKLAGYWEFPGGKIEANETPQSCLERELLEELGVVASAGKIIAESVYEYEHGAIRLLGIETILQEHDFNLSVHDKIAWVEIRKLTTHNLSPADIPIAQAITGY